ncbi:MAG: beta-lactamase family protein, partial [bacterium]|nr:beta-lactamase family protein [bacterium]
MKISKFPWQIIIGLVLFLAIQPLPAQETEEAPAETLTAIETTPPPRLSQMEIDSIETFIKEQQEKSKIPGLAVAIVKGDHTVYKNGFGFADVDKQMPVTPKALFELGSTSKAFTGLAILILESRGLLNRNDTVDTYLPWLKLSFQGREVKPRISHFMHHTSGIPFKSLGLIPKSSADNALEETVRKLVNYELENTPGSEFIYATINFDVLGLVIETVSGMPFEDYITKTLLVPLDMQKTFVVGKKARPAEMATGYKLSFGSASVYDAPVYRGNAPAGYIVSNIEDMAQWLKFQTGSIDSKIEKSLIEKSHTPKQYGMGNYFAGWFAFPNEGVILHAGTNPNYSAFVGFNPASKTGVVVLSNMNSDFSTGMGIGVLEILKGAKPQPVTRDLTTAFDNMAIKVLMLAPPFLVAALILFLRTLVGIIRKKRLFDLKGAWGVLVFFTMTVPLCLIQYYIIKLPVLLGFALPWGTIAVWGPSSFIYAILSIAIMLLMFYFYFLLIFFF